MSSRAAARMRDDTDAPDPEAPGKPDSPTEVTRRSWKYVLGKVVREFGSDRCTDIAATLTYYFVLSLFPFLVAVFSLLGVVGQSGAAAAQVLDILSQVAPSASETLRGPIEDISASPAAGFALVSGLVLAVWSASGYVGAFGRGMNRIYEIEEGRGFVKLKGTQLLVTLILIVLLVVAAVILIVSGPVTDAIGSAIGAGEVVTTVWSIAKWPVLAFVVVLMVAILYYASPNAKQPKFRWVSFGSLIAILVLALALTGFGFYVANFSNYGRTYGTFAGIIVFLLLIWITNLALLFGAEFDAELERGRELQAGIEAEETLQLPPRDTKVIEKKAAKEERDVAEGRRIRETRGRDDADAGDDRDDDHDGRRRKRGLFRSHR